MPSDMDLLDKPLPDWLREKLGQINIGDCDFEHSVFFQDIVNRALESEAIGKSIISMLSDTARRMTGLHQDNIDTEGHIATCLLSAIMARADIDMDGLLAQIKSSDLGEIPCREDYPTFRENVDVLMEFCLSRTDKEAKPILEELVALNPQWDNSCSTQGAYLYNAIYSLATLEPRYAPFMAKIAPHKTKEALIMWLGGNPSILSERQIEILTVFANAQGEWVSLAQFADQKDVIDETGVEQNTVQPLFKEVGEVIFIGQQYFPTVKFNSYGRGFNEPEMVVTGAKAGTVYHRPEMRFVINS